MKFAICFFGQPRFLNNVCVQRCYKDIIAKYNADVYVHNWVSGKNQKMDVSDFAKCHQISENEDAAEQIISIYKPKKYRFDAPFRGELSDHARNIAKTLGVYNENNERNLLSHLKSYSEAIRLIDDPEEYDFVLMTRFDAYLFEFPDLTKLDTKKMYLTKRYDGGWCDITQLSGGKLASSFNVFDNIEILTKKIGDIKENFIAELYKRENYLLSNKMEDVVYLQDLSSGLVRSDNCIQQIQT